MPDARYLWAMCVLSLVSSHSWSQDARSRAAGSDIEMSFFEYLGTMVDDDGEWIDPLQFEASGEMNQQLQDVRATAVQADKAQVNEVPAGTTPTPAQENEL